ncbi:MAG: hypothetical protein HGA96_04270 [Desulfobulbaceae bacterium]|nr:hypothetical protein [Desulfobulbaceae bacterium]
MSLSAYWLHPGGEVQTVRLTHIAAVIDAPEKFGETPASLKQEYERFQERMPHEGKAREVIMARILDRGYIRIRERRNGWVVQLRELTPSCVKALCDWAELVRPTVSDRYGDVVINTLADLKTIRTSFDRLEASLN